MSDPVVVSAVRTPVGSFGGALRDIPATKLGGIAIGAALTRAGVPADALDEVLMGNIYQGAAGPNPARQAAVGAGVPYCVPSATINKLCGSGLKAIALAAQAVRAGEADCIAAGGMESMSGAPYALTQARWGQRMGHGELVDTMVLDGLWDCFYDCHMGMTAENLAEEYGITRADQDRFAFQSQERCGSATAEGRFVGQIVPVEVPPARRGQEAVVVDGDEHPRPDTSLEKLAQLRPAFRDDGSVTAGNASGINDGAAAMVVVSEKAARAAGASPLATIRGTAAAGVDPRIMGIGPAPAIAKLLERLGLSLADIDLLEVNEAFAAQTLAVGRELDWDEALVNVNGGAIALGHPVGASGARIAVTLLHEMSRRQVRRGIAALCIGGGMGIATLFEREEWYTPSRAPPLRASRRPVLPRLPRSPATRLRRLHQLPPERLRSAASAGPAGF
ncbi:acetyl-CoA C-acetyltransferase [Candidatus Latescibacterota bacterium]